MAFKEHDFRLNVLNNLQSFLRSLAVAAPLGRSSQRRIAFLSGWSRPSGRGASKEHAQDGRGVKRPPKGLRSVSFLTVARIRALCASKEHAQDGRGIKRPPKGLGSVSSLMVARIRALCAPKLAAAWDETNAPSLANSALLAFIGGFMDGFTYVGHGHVFANAMTGNVVLLGIYGAARAWHQSLRHLPPIVTFMFGIWVARGILLPRMREILRYPYLSVVVVELSIIGVVSSLPNWTRDFWITTSIAFAASIQVEAFRVVNGRSFNSTFTTGNLRSLSEGLFDWAFQHNIDEARAKARDFAVICLTFFLGAVGGGSSVSRFGNRALFIDFMLLLVLLVRLWPRGSGMAPTVIS